MAALICGSIVGLLWVSASESLCINSESLYSFSKSTYMNQQILTVCCLFTVYVSPVFYTVSFCRLLLLAVEVLMSASVCIEWWKLENGDVSGVVQMWLMIVSWVQWTAFRCHSCWWRWMLTAQTLFQTHSLSRHSSFSAVVLQLSIRQPTFASSTLQSVLMMREGSVTLLVICLMCSVFFSIVLSCVHGHVLKSHVLSVMLSAQLQQN